MRTATRLQHAPGQPSEVPALRAADRAPPTPQWPALPREQRREMLRVLASLFGMGTLVLAAALLMPMWPQTHHGLLAGIVAAGAAGTTTLVVAARRDPPVWLAVGGVTFGAVLVTLAAWAMGPVGSASAGTFYVFASAYTFYYLPRSWAIAETALAGAGYGVVLALLDARAGAAQWTLTMGAASITAWVIADLARRRLASERSESDRLRLTDDLRTLFLRTVNHDLRGPLTIISGFAQTLAETDEQVPLDRQMLARRIVTNAARLQGMLDDLLALDRLNTGEVALEREPTDLVGLVVRSIDLDSDRHPGVVIKGPGRLIVDVDAACIEHAVTNLVGNAAKFCQPGTPVEITIGEDAEGVTIRVDDDGPGVPDDRKQAIFEAFVRGPNAGRGNGSGIGLSIARRLARLHGGDITVHDRPGGGARFVLRLPR